MLKTSAPELLPALGAARAGALAGLCAAAESRGVMSLVVFTALTGLVCAGTPMNPVLAATAILCIAVGPGPRARSTCGTMPTSTPSCAAPRGRPVPSGRVQGRRRPGAGRSP